MSFQSSLKAVIPHAATDKSLPILNSVRVEPGKSIATDRYTLARSTWDMGDIEPFEPFVLRVADAKELAKVKETLTNVTVEDNKVTFTFNGGERTQVFSTVEGDFPLVEKLIPEGEPDVTDVIGLNPDFLARLRYSNIARERRERSQPVKFTFYGPNKPVKAEFGEHFTAVLMPVRLP